MTQITKTTRTRKTPLNSNVPRQWNWKDVEDITKQKVVDMENRTHWVVCTLENGIKFSFKKW